MGKAIKTIGKGIGKIFPYGGIGILSKALDKKKSKPQPSPVMPFSDDEAVRKKRQRSIAEQLQRGGRTSTILTNDSEKLGGY